MYVYRLRCRAVIRGLFFAGILLPVAGVHAAENLERLALCHYTAWHEPFNASRTAARFINFPEFPASGSRMQDYRGEIGLAREQGIDGFLVDIIVKGGDSAGYAGQMRELLRAAAGTPFLVGPCLDMAHSFRDDPDLRTLAANLSRIFATAGASPNFPKVGDKYVLATYTWRQLEPAQWQDLRQRLSDEGFEIFLIANMSHAFSKLTEQEILRYAPVCDMIYSFGEYGISGQSIAECFAIYRQAAKEAGRYWMPVIHPGYVGGWFNGRNDYYQPHRGFDQVYDCFAAIDNKASDWLHLTTWNDHDETPLMPMIFEYGSNTEINRAFIDRWKGEPYRTEEPKLFFAYHREEILGTVWRLEALSLPCADAETVRISGKLVDVGGEILHTLTPRELSMNRFARCEWAIPTAPFASTPAVTPVVTWQAGNKKITRRLPDTLLKTGWLQNQTTLKVPAHRMADGKAELKIVQDGHRLTATVDLASPETIRQATLWRNDRPLGAFKARDADATLLHVDMHQLQRCSFEMSLEGAEFLSAGQKHQEQGEGYTLTRDRLTVERSAPWMPARAVIAATPQSRLSIKVNNQDAVTLTVKELLERHTVALGKNGPLLWFRHADYDTNIMNHNSLGKREGTFTLRRFSRTSRPDDLFYVRVRTAGDTFYFSPVQAPFATDRAPRKIRVVETYVNLETSSGHTGRAGQSGFLTPPPLTTPTLTTVNAHPAIFRAGRWTFERDGWDECGERPLQDKKHIPWTKVRLVDEVDDSHGSALILEGTSVAMRARSYPIGACTIEVDVWPEDGVTEKQRILGRSGWQSAFEIHLLPDGHVEVVRSGGETDPVSFRSEHALPARTWSRLRLTFDEITAKLFIDSQLDAQKEMPLIHNYGNCTGRIGPFHGRIDNVTLLSWPSEPGDEAFPAFEKHAPLDPVYIDYGVRSTGDRKTVSRWKIPEKTVRQEGNPAEATAPRGENAAPRAVVGADGGVALVVGRGRRRAASATLLERLEEGRELSIELQDFSFRKEPTGWTALLLRLRNNRGESVNFNVSGPDRGFISTNLPDWHNAGSDFSFQLPCTFRFQRFGGKILLAVNDKRVFLADDDPNDPLSQLAINMTFQKRTDAGCAVFSPPALADLKPASAGGADK